MFIKSIPLSILLSTVVAAQGSGTASNNISAGVFSAIDSKLEELSTLNTEIWSNPELAYSEVYAHEILTDYLEEQGFNVTRGAYNLSTAFRAEFLQGEGGRTISFNAEYDALEGIGHACGHNLIATSAVVAALGAKEALENQGVEGTVVLFGTPAEEGGGGKVRMLDAGAYENLDCNIMAHPAPTNYISYFSSKAAWAGRVNFTGFGTHASAAPWQGRNAMDAFVAAYTMAGLYRQQIEQTDRIHHVVDNEDSQLVNVIPDKASTQWAVRSSTLTRRNVLLERVQTIIKAAALGTNTTVEIADYLDYWNVVSNEALARLHYDILTTYFDPSLDNSTAVYTVRDIDNQVNNPTEGGSTDEGNVSHFLPSIHVAFPITTTAVQHNSAFQEAAGTDHAFSQAIIIGKTMALTGIEVLRNETLASVMWEQFNSMEDG
ncbi:hypothetical protein BS50DRAFT_514628 [Corynespora cassiicola Philippines]|uniref:Peptidase M20 domain-containing protein 2 n=1 Tax=Corynespora cassiicola Philippines TaxID=1448308 RepID=A0A2T2P6S7_CORCC|nr:hypothetical protein BS50DRAFT_514628 [Corynespora cassiicola Philippines]